MQLTVDNHYHSEFKYVLSSASYSIKSTHPALDVYELIHTATSILKEFNMTTTKSSIAKKSPAASPKKQDVIDQLISDHKKVKKLFKDFEKLSKAEDVTGKAQVANQICLELTVHATAEEEVFYTNALKATRDDDLINEANVEHDSAKSLIAQIQSLEPSDPMYDAKVTVLGEYIDHHVEEEETEMFPEVRKAKKLDLEALNLQLTQSKEAILAKLISKDGVIDVAALKSLTQEAAAHTH